MLAGKATHEAQIDAIMRATNAVSRSQAEQILAIESGESDGDVQAVDEHGQRVPATSPKDERR